MNLTYQQFLQILLADVAKAPLLIADVQQIGIDCEKLVTDAGLPLPAVLTPAAKSAAVLDLESRFTAAKLGDGTLLAGLLNLFNNPTIQALLGALLGKLLGGIGTAPAPTA
jgi:hypothetical protein